MIPILAAVTWYYFASYAPGFFNAGNIGGPFTKADCAMIKTLSERVDGHNGIASKYACLPVTLPK